MRINTRRGRALTLSEPLGIVRAAGSLLLICSLLSLCRGLLMLHEHDWTTGVNTTHFWLEMTIATAILGLLLSSPPRWRWVFDIDLNSANSYKTIFNIPSGKVHSFVISDFDKAIVSKIPTNHYALEIINIAGDRTLVEGIVSKSEGMPRIAAFRLNELIVNFKEMARAESSLNSPGVTLREAGIYAPVDPLLYGPALDSFQKTISPTLLRSISTRDYAFQLTGAISAEFVSHKSVLLEELGIRSFSAIQMLLLFDLCVPSLRELSRPSFLDLSRRVTLNDDLKFADHVYAFALEARFDRFVGRYYRSMSVEPPVGTDLSTVLSECLKVIATVASVEHATVRPLNPPRSIGEKDVVYFDPIASEASSLMNRRAYNAGVNELSQGFVAEWTPPAATILEMRKVLTTIAAVASLPMRNVLMRACAAAATLDGILNAQSWAFLRGIADVLSVSVPPSIHEPILEAMVPVANLKPRLQTTEQHMS